MSSDQYRQWIEAYCNETMTPDEFSQFEKALTESATLRAELRQYLALDAHLQQGAEAALEVSGAWGKESNVRRRGMGVWVWAVAASVLFLIGLSIGWQFASPDGSTAQHDPDSESSSLNEPTDDGVAFLSASVEAVWEDDAPAVGSVLSGRTLTLTSGLAELQFYSGARLILEGPAEVELVSAYRAICRNGRIRARVPEEARGFALLTASFSLIDLGTEFGLNLGENGDAQVRVFEGEVELHSRDRKQLLVSGQAVAVDATGGSTPLAEADDGTVFPSFSGMQSRAEAHTRVKLEKWRHWNDSLADDRRIVARFDFENGTIGRGAVVGCAWTDGRWPGKGGLEFRRTGDRVRVNIPGEFEALTMSAWIRVDALPARRQALLLTDRYEVGRVHWQIGPNGELRLGTRVQNGGKEVGTGYASPPLFKPRRIGSWSFVATTYDRAAGEVKHYLNGRQVSRHEIVYVERLQIGAGDIGNWSVPLESPRRPMPIRNFTGRMDELTIWNTALDASEIKDIYRIYQP